jgi:hypothetical protein
MRIIPEGFGCLAPKAFVVSAGESRSAFATAAGNVVTSLASLSLREIWERIS